jgi:stress-induced morphogen
LQTAIGLTLQQRFALQVISDRYRAQQYRHASALRRLNRITTVQLIQRHRLVNAATRQAKNASEHQNKRKAQSSHRPIQVVATRLTTVKILNKYEERSATPALERPYHP